MGKYDKYINSTGTHYLSNSGSDENKNIHGGKAGDQTGNEWQLRSWYNRPWTHVFRYTKDVRVGLKIAELGCAAALNDNVGYDQYQRTTYWEQLQKASFDPSNIKVACEADCSAGSVANIKAAGYLLGIKELQNVNYRMTSRNTIAQLTNAGFTMLTDKKYLTSGKYLLPGDILLYANHHVSTNVTKGAKAEENEPVTPTIPAEDLGQVIGVATAKNPMNIRTEPEANAKSITTISKGTKLEVLEVLDSGWYKVVCNKSSNGYGYTSNKNNKYYTYEEIKASSGVVTAANKPNKFNVDFKGSYKVTASQSLYIRHGAGSPNKAMLTAPKGSILECDGSYDVYNGTTWLYIKYVYKYVTYYGFCSTKYLEKV